MPDVAVDSLDPRLRRLEEKARAAWESGHCGYVAEACAEILRHAPGCLPVRRLQREARLRQISPGCRLRGRVITAWIRAGGWCRGRADAAGRLEVAEEMLAAAPNDRAGLKLLAGAATELALPETAVFAWECLCEVQPQHGPTLGGLGEAYLNAGRPTEALALAEAWQRQRPQDDGAVGLLRKASVALTMRGGEWARAEADVGPPSQVESRRSKAPAGSSPIRPPQRSTEL